MKIITQLCALFALCISTASISAEPAESPMSPLEIAAKQKADNEAQTEVRKLVNLALHLCNEAYPKMPFVQCMDKMKHGLGDALDPHTRFLSAKEVIRDDAESSGKFGGVGLELIKSKTPTSYVVVHLVTEGTPAHKVGLRAGDMITAINDISTQSFPDITKAIDLLRGDPGTSVRIKVARTDSKPIEFNVIREEIVIPQIQATLLRFQGKTYALLTASHFEEDFANEMKSKYLKLAKEARGKLSGLIVNLEGNPGGRLDEVYNAVYLFMRPESIVLTRANNGTEKYEPETEAKMRPEGDITKGLPITVVVDDESASASELFAAALKHYGRAVVLGTSVTFGKGSVQVTRILPDDEEVRITNAEYLIGSFTDWVPVQCIGVMPDIIFDYPGTKVRAKAVRECEIHSHIDSVGMMPNAPLHIPIKDAQPSMYQAALEMLEAFKSYRLPVILANEKAQ